MNWVFFHVIKACNSFWRISLQLIKYLWVFPFWKIIFVLLIAMKLWVIRCKCVWLAAELNSSISILHHGDFLVLDQSTIPTSWVSLLQWSWIACWSSPWLYRHGYSFQIQAHARFQCIASYGLGCIWFTCRAICNWGLLASHYVKYVRYLLIILLDCVLLMHHVTYFQTGTHPKVTTMKNIGRFRSQVLKSPILSWYSSIISTNLEDVCVYILLVSLFT